jgi:hypothetical protein
MNVSREIQYAGHPGMLAQLVSDLEVAGCEVTPSWAPPVIEASGTLDAIQTGVDTFQARNTGYRVFINHPHFSRGVAEGQPKVLHAVNQQFGQTDVSLCGGMPVRIVPGRFSLSYSWNCAECEAEVAHR